MRYTILFLFVCWATLPALAAPSITELLSWGDSPDQVMAKLENRGAKPELKIFHKTGVRYIKAELSELGNRWEATVYFDETDRANQLLLQLEEVSRSQANRVSKLAVGEFGKGYTVKNRGGGNRNDHLFLWKLPKCKVKLTTATYKSSDGATLWLALTPP